MTPWTPAEKETVQGDSLWLLQIWHDYSSNKFPWKKWSRSLFEDDLHTSVLGNGILLKALNHCLALIKNILTLKEHPKGRKYCSPSTVPQCGGTTAFWSTFYHLNLFRRAVIHQLACCIELRRTALEPRGNTWMWKITRDVSTPWADRQLWS